VRIISMIAGVGRCGGKRNGRSDNGDAEHEPAKPG
jgi:hypothetical protein